MKKHVRIVYMIGSPYNARDHKRFGIETLRSAGYHVDIWDFIDTMKNMSRVRESVDNYFDSSMIRLDCRRKISSLIKEINEPVLVVSQLPQDRLTAFIFRELNSNPCIKYVKLLLGNIPSVSNYSFNIYRKITSKKILSTLLNKMMCHKHYQPHLSIISSAKDEKGTKENLKTHSLDYNIFLEEKESNRCIIENDYAVFIDSGEAGYYHTDLLYHNMKMLISPECYFAEIKEYFDYFEDKYKIPIVIAVHPRVKYKGNEYGMRRMVKGSTHNLIRHSQVVLSHYSTSLNFAVIHRKPIVCLRFSKNYRECLNKRYPDAWINVLNISNHITLGDKSTFSLKNDLAAIDEEAYVEYFNNYIKYPGSEEVDTWVLLSRWLDSNWKKLFRNLKNG